MRGTVPLVLLACTAASSIARSADPAVGQLRYAAPETLLPREREPPDLRLFYEQLHAPPFPRDQVAAESEVAPPWLAAGIEGQPRPDRVVHAVSPRRADPTVGKFLAANLVLFDRPALAAPLLVWLTGTGGSPLDAGLFLPAAADAGYRVVSLAYDDEPPGTQLCETSSDPDCFARFRTDRLWGDGALPALATPPAEAIVWRLTHLLRQLAQDYPNEAWDQYLAGDEPAWARLALAGQSMGAGMAAFLARERVVSRVILSSSPWDHHRPEGALAPWLNGTGATPPERWVAVYHAREPMAPVLARAFAALGLSPSHILAARLVPHGLLSAPIASPVFHGCWFGAAVPLNPEWQPTTEVREIWKFLLGRPVKQISD